MDEAKGMGKYFDIDGSIEMLISIQGLNKLWVPKFESEIKSKGKLQWIRSLEWGQGQNSVERLGLHTIYIHRSITLLFHNS